VGRKEEIDAIKKKYPSYHVARKMSFVVPNGGALEFGSTKLSGFKVFQNAYV